MALRTLILETFKDEEFGTDGLRPVSVHVPPDYFAATSGVIFAHDLLEHQNGFESIGGERGIDDEFQALGALWYVRGQFNDLRRDGVMSRYSAAENISSDIVRMFGEHCHGANVSDAKRTRPCEVDYAFAKILEYAARDWVGDSESPYTHATLWPAYRAAALAGMRTGYRKAARKYKSATAANNLFWAVADAVEPYAKRGDIGAQCRLRYGTRDGRVVAHCETYYPED